MAFHQTIEQPVRGIMLPYALRSFPYNSLLESPALMALSLLSEYFQSLGPISRAIIVYMQ